MAERYRQILLEEASLDCGLQVRGDRPPPDPSWEPIPWSMPVAYLAATPEDFARELGLVFQRTHDEGLGYLDLAVLDLASGARLAVARYQSMPEGSGTLVKLLPQQFVNGFRSARDAVASDEYWPEDRAARGAAVEAALDGATEDVLRDLADAVGPHLVRITWQREPGVWREPQT